MMKKENTDTVGYIREHLQKPVVLVGMMGSGKSHIGSRLAHALGLEFYDSDRLVEERAGLSVQEIFTEYGEEKFRQAESRAITETLERGACVLATGGGAVLKDETRDTIKLKAVSVWLQSPVAHLLKRLESAADRPLLKNGDPAEILTKLLEVREPLYRQADITMDTSLASQQQTIEALINALYAHIKAGKF